MGVIYRGGMNEPRTVSLPVGGAYTPGSAVVIGATSLTQATAPTGRWGVLANRDFYGQDELTAYASGDTGVAYEVAPLQQYKCQVAAATYTHGQELTIGASGRLVAAASGNIVAAFFTDEVKAGVAQAAGALCDVTIANFYTKP